MATADSGRRALVGLRIFKTFVLFPVAAVGVWIQKSTSSSIGGKYEPI